MDCTAVARLALALAAAILLPASALATVGVGVGTVPLTVAERVVPGHTYRVRPDFYLVNTGDHTTTYTLRVERLSAQDGSTLLPSWVALAPITRRLAPGEHALVHVLLHLPRGVGGGSYASDIVASGAAGAGRNGVAVGAAAATPIRITVGGTRGSLGWPWPLWVNLVAGGALVLLTLAAVARRVGLRVVVERPAHRGPTA